MRTEPIPWYPQELNHNIRTRLCGSIEAVPADDIDKWLETQSGAISQGLRNAYGLPPFDLSFAWNQRRDTLLRLRIGMEKQWPDSLVWMANDFLTEFLLKMAEAFQEQPFASYPGGALRLICHSWDRPYRLYWHPYQDTIAPIPGFCQEPIVIRQVTSQVNITIRYPKFHWNILDAGFPARANRHLAGCGSPYRIDRIPDKFTISLTADIKDLEAMDDSHFAKSIGLSPLLTHLSCLREQ